MKFLSAVALVLTVTSSVGPRAQVMVGDPYVRVRLSGTADAGRCSFEYFLIGGFGGYGGFATPNAASEFEIGAVHEGQVVERLKAVLRCAGYQTQTLTFDSMPDVAGRMIALHPEPLGTVPFHGVVRGLPENEPARDVDVGYLPSWRCEFFNLPDCLLASSTVASARVGIDGTFSAAVPDVAQDPAIKAFTDRGELRFLIRDAKTRNPLYELKPIANRAGGGIRIAESYPGEQTFVAEPRR